MKAKLLFTIICIAPMTANAAIPYRVEQINMPTVHENETYASEHGFYIGGMYNLSLWQNYTDDTNLAINGKSTQNFEALAGIRIFDTFRMELNYVHQTAKWNQLEFDSETILANAIIDSRIDSLYRILRNQMVMPYVGFGAGAAWNFGDNGTQVTKKISPVVAAMAGISIEFNPIFALDFGYRYLYMFSQKNNIMPEFNPSTHQFRIGARIGF